MCVLCIENEQSDISFPQNCVDCPVRVVLELQGMQLIWDSEDTGPIYAEESFVEYAKLLWDMGKEKRDIICELRENKLFLREAA